MCVISERRKGKIYEVHQKMLLGIALILFGFFLFYASVLADWGILQVVGFFLPVIGILLVIFEMIPREP